MLRSEAIALIQQQLGFTTAMSSTITSNLQLSQQVLEQAPTKPWFLITEDSYIDTVSGEQRIPLPTDFLQETDDALLRYVPTDTTEEEVDLWKDDYDVLMENFKDTVTRVMREGSPEAYALMGSYFRIFPLPDDAYRLRMIYYAKAEVLSSDIENAWLKYAPYLLMGHAGKNVAAAMRDSNALGVFTGWEREGRLILTTQNEARQHSNRRYQMGGPH